jgi:hypothetical protein
MGRRRTQKSRRTKSRRTKSRRYRRQRGGDETNSYENQGESFMGNISNTINKSSEKVSKWFEDPNWIPENTTGTGGKRRRKYRRTHKK